MLARCHLLLTVSRLSVILADDSDEFLDVMRRAVQRTSTLELLATASDGREAARLIALHRPDAAVLDDRMPWLRGIEVAERAIAAGTSTHIVIVSANPAPDLLSRADVHNITVIDKSRPIGTVIQSCHATLVDDGRAEEAG